VRDLAGAVFLTGGTGFIGVHVLQALLERGYEVRALARHPNRLPDHPRVEAVPGDLESPGGLVEALRGCRYLVHVAAAYSFAPRDRPRMAFVNVRGTSGLMAAGLIAGVEKAVVTSSSATVGPASQNGAATELDWAPPTARVSAYHHSKVDQERAALAARLPTVMVLPTAPIGPGDWKPTPTGRMVVDFLRGRIFATLDGGLNLVDVRDVARAHVLALERGRPRVRYLVGGQNLSLGEIWQLLGRVSGRRPPRFRIPYAAAAGLAWADELRCRATGAAPVVPLEGVQMARERMHVDPTRSLTELGLEASRVEGAAADAVAWYRSHGYA
jgi:dihydroflavonol-4-reductase